MRGSFDFESWDWVKPFACALYLQDGMCDFLTDGTRKQYQTNPQPEKFAERVLIDMANCEQVTDWWAHNMGKYDGLILSAAAKRLNWKQSANVRGDGRVISLRIWPNNGKRSIRLLDSYAVVPTNLRNAAEDFELPSRKLFSKDDYSTDPRFWPEDKLRNGCLVDAKLVLELLDKAETLFEQFGGKLKTTFSSSALSIVKADLKQRGESIPSHKGGNLELNMTARKAYYGARVEVLHHKPSGLLTEWDVCSSYPWAMTQNLPWVPLGNGKKKSFEELLTEGSRYEGILEATVVVPDSAYPCLPFRPKTGGVYFPTGTWRAWFPAVELRYAIANGVSVIPHDAILYEQASPFTDFVRDVYNVKSTAKGALRTFAKYVLNGCYGKFGSKPEKHEYTIFPNAFEARMFMLSKPGKCTPISNDETAIAVSKEVWNDYTHFAVAAYITAEARIKLHKAMVASSGLAYVDSDSIHAASLALSKDSFGGDLGQWKVEVPLMRGEYYAPKVYKLQPVAPVPDKPASAMINYLDSGKGHYASKGFPVDEQSFAKVVLRQSVEVERMRLFKSQVRAGGTDFVRIKEEKAWKGVSGKRCPRPDGGTRAWSVAELQAGLHKQAISPLLADDTTDFIEDDYV